MCPGVFWGKYESGCAKPRCLGPEYCNDFQGTDRADPLIGVRLISDRSGHQSPMFLHAGESIDASPD